MYRYRVRPLHQSDKLVIEFMHVPEDEGFRDALRAVFEPLGYVAKFDGNYFYMDSGSTVQNEMGISIFTDEFGSIWCDANQWGEVSRNKAGISYVDKLLQASGAFSRGEQNDV